MNEQANPARATPHPLAGKTLSGADTVVQVLADEGDVAVKGSGAAKHIVHLHVPRNEPTGLAPGIRPVTMAIERLMVDMASNLLK